MWCLQLLKHLDGLIKEEAERGWKPPEGQESSCVLGSANQLFLKIRASLNRCVKLVSRGSTLLRLSGAFKVCAVRVHEATVKQRTVSGGSCWAAAGSRLLWAITHAGLLLSLLMAAVH